MRHVKGVRVLLVPTLCVGTRVPTLCVELKKRNKIAIAVK